MPDISNRRAFLRLAGNAFALAAVSAAGVRFVDIAEAVPVAPALGSPLMRTNLVTPAQWAPPHGPGWRRRSRRGRRWVCWWHRGRRQCGWRW